jgi:hypothetical protein
MKKSGLQERMALRPVARLDVRDSLDTLRNAQLGKDYSFFVNAGTPVRPPVRSGSRIIFPVASVEACIPDRLELVYYIGTTVPNIMLYQLYKL